MNSYFCFRDLVSLPPGINFRLLGGQGILVMGGGMHGAGSVMSVMHSCLERGGW